MTIMTTNNKYILQENGTKKNKNKNNVYQPTSTQIN